MGSSITGLGDQRRDIRFPTSFRAAILWGGRITPVEVVDIANHGVRLSGPDLPSVSSIIQLGARGLDERAHVVWRANGQCGVRFVHRISALGVVRANCFPDRRGETRRGPTHVVPEWLHEEALLDGPEAGLEGHISQPKLPSTSTIQKRY